MDGKQPIGQYDSDFFRYIKDGACRSAKVVLSTIWDAFQPTSVVDIGCGTGDWLNVCSEMGANDVLGLDGNYVDRSYLQIAETQFVPWDLERPVDLTRRFDLAMSLEVGEHLSAKVAAQLVQSLCRLSDVVLFSAAIPGQSGNHHINEQWPEYWAGLFAEQGYAVLDMVRDRVWDHPDVEWWYAQNLLVYVRSECLPEHALIGRYVVPVSKRLRRVHYKHYEHLVGVQAALDKGELLPPLPKASRIAYRAFCASVRYHLNSLAAYGARSAKTASVAPVRGQA